MSAPHPRPWRAGSLFGNGPRRALSREQRDRFRYLLLSCARSRRLSAKGLWVGMALLKRLGEDGRCDPSHETLAADSGCDVRTVRRALATLRSFGLVCWQTRLVRVGWRAAQTSNAYQLIPEATIPAASCCGGHFVRQTLKKDISLVPQQFTPQAVRVAQASLAKRRAVIEERLLMKGRD